MDLKHSFIFIALKTLDLKRLMPGPFLDLKRLMPGPFLDFKRLMSGPFLKTLDPF